MKRIGFVASVAGLANVSRQKRASCQSCDHLGLENGRYPRVEHLIAIADVLEVSVDQLLGRQVNGVEAGRQVQ